MDAGNNSTAETELETMNGYQGTSLRSSPRTKTKDKERKPAQQSIDIVDGYPGKFLENITNNLGVDREPDLGLALTVWNCWASSMNKKPKCHRSDANLPAHIPYAGELSMLTSEQAETCLLLLLSRLRVGGSVTLPIPSLVRIYNHLANFFMLSCANPATYTSLILRGLHIGKELQRQRGADGRTSDAEDATSVVGGAGVTPVTAEHENALWDSSVFSVDSAEGASYAAFFYMCKTFRLLDLQKHARLSPRDLITDEREDTDGKMRQCLRLTPSDGQSDSSPCCWESADSHSPWCVLRTYLRCLPNGASSFYLQPAAGCTFVEARLQERRLASYMQEMMEKAQMPGNYSLASFSNYFDMERRVSEIDDDPSPHTSTPTTAVDITTNANASTAIIDLLPGGHAIKSEPVDEETSMELNETAVKEEPVDDNDNERVEGDTVVREWPAGLPPGYVVHDITPLTHDPDVVNPLPRRPLAGKPPPSPPRSPPVSTPPASRKKGSLPPGSKPEAEVDVEAVLGEAGQAAMDRKTKCKMLLGVIEKLISNQSADNVTQAKSLLEKLRVVSMPTVTEATPATPDAMPQLIVTATGGAPELCTRLASPPLPAGAPAKLRTLLMQRPAPSPILTSVLTAPQVLPVVVPLTEAPPACVATPLQVAPAEESAEESMVVSLSEILPRDAVIRPQDITITKNENAAFGCVQISIKYAKRVVKKVKIP